MDAAWVAILEGRGPGHAGLASMDPLEVLEESGLLEVLLACWSSKDEVSLIVI